MHPTDHRAVATSALALVEAWAADQNQALPLVLPVLRLLAAGCPATLPAVAAAGGRPVEETERLLRSIPDIEWDRGQVVGWGLTLVPTPHRLVISGRTLYAWCASDTLTFPILLEVPARIESVCRGSGRAVRMEVTPRRLGRPDPPTAVASFAVAGCRVGTPRANLCDRSHFFTSTGAATGWLVRHPEAAVLPLEGAFPLARRVGEMLRSRATTTTSEPPSTSPPWRGDARTGERPSRARPRVDEGRHP